MDHTAVIASLDIFRSERERLTHARWFRLRIAILLLLLAACSPGSREKAALLAPLHVAIAYDVSGSVAQLELPVITMEHVDKVISLVKKRGGSIAFGLIDEKAFEALARLELERVAGRLDERARMNQKIKKAEAEFEALVEKKINRPRNAKRTDVKGSIARLGLFFREPTIPENAEKVALFISDGIDTGPWRRLTGIKLPNDVKVYVIGMEVGLARKLFGEQAILFESIDSAIESLSPKSSAERGS